MYGYQYMIKREKKVLHVSLVFLNVFIIHC